jgi:hypothetical protein
VTQAVEQSDGEFWLAWERASHLYLNGETFEQEIAGVCYEEHSVRLALKNAYKMGLEVGYRLGKLKA